VIGAAILSLSTGCGHAQEEVMLRRLFFVIPDAAGTAPIVTDLESIGVDLGHMHALTTGQIPAGLPPATDRQRRDVIWRVEQIFWIGLLVIFALALVGQFAAWRAGSLPWVLTTAVVMGASVAAGVWFAQRVPDTHLDEFRGALEHGEVLLMVDVPRQRVAEIEEQMRRRHPEATVGGVGWTLGILGV
jgi:hypothetical protein